MKITNIVGNFEVYLAVLTYWKLVLKIYAQKWTTK